MIADELLQRIVAGSGRVYSHEAKDMARELLEWRTKAIAAKAVAAKAAQNAPGQPFPHGLYP